MFKAFNKVNKELVKNRRLIVSMGLKDFKNEYAGSVLGGIWGFLKPFMMIVAYWFVFSSGIRETNGIEVPYIAWLIPGLFAWTFFSDSLTLGTSSIRVNAYLVKKMVFPVSILPVVKIFSNLLNHFIFMGIAVAVLYLQGVSLNVYAFQFIYYLFAGCIFTLAIVRLLSAMAVMSVDIVHLINTVMQLLFWGTPVVWHPVDIASKGGIFPLLIQLMKLNPYFYLVEGYRNCFVQQVWFWEQPMYMLYFWCVTILLLLFSSYYYEKNRKEFADVL